ncbi:family 10 glycosylhydrolase [Hymenobacter sp. 5516J-16]|uniref:glycoside hydrolase family 10 protein n=1 Tax=Hymenobacter sp. 5516J-16 TaxID=2932253 RepID=UPI001FD295B1|nr:family 10 glycosylhydrolase [Hymenobacter sp. 5516J-16]UOQ78024.1 family 10 glycosylhydrolase [Hymenobacter sp. 5516J-16]
MPSRQPAGWCRRRAAQAGVARVWIATVENIDWPSSRSLTPEQQRREYRRMLDDHQRSGINALFVQVRPASDAFYQSSLEPWSKWLTGQQGKAPAPYYDPLPFLIEEAHNRGMEFHAWFNPYRATMDTVTRRLAPNHPYRKHPEWFLRYSGKLLYNPGLPEVRNYISEVILDVVRRYDIDGVHFDDYFYPYPEAGQVIHDEDAFARFNPDGLKLADWRRQNVNTLIHELHDTIHHTKRWVKFGISPFGVWRNQSTDPNGSATKAFQGYDGLYADALEWLRQGWVDYVLPQLYWSTGFRVAQYPVLVEWWARNSNGRHLYIGHGAYRMSESTKSDTVWRNPRELPRQVRLNRTFPTEVSGSVFFSSKSLMANVLHTTDSLRQHEFRYPALVPTMPWLDAVPPRPAQNLTVATEAAANTLTWQPGPAAADGDQAAYYALYRFADDQTPTPMTPAICLPYSGPAWPQAKFCRHYSPLRARLRLLSHRLRPPAQRKSAYLGAHYWPRHRGNCGPNGPARIRAVACRTGSCPQPNAPGPAYATPTAPRPTTTVNSPTKVKVKTKPKRRGLFERIFGRR